MVWRALFGCLEGAPLSDYGDFEIAHATEILAWRDYYAPDYADVWGGGPHVVQPASKGKQEEGSTSTEGREAIATSSTLLVASPPPFNLTARFFLQLQQDYHGQRADKMKSLRTFARGSDESLREAHSRLRRLITATHGVTEQQAVQHWYSILDKELKTLVRGEALRLGVPPTLRYVFEISERIEINLLEEKAAMGFLRTKDKPPEKTKSAKASIPTNTADTDIVCFNCGGVGHRRRDCKKSSKTETAKIGGFCSGCGVKGHAEASCWKVHPELKPKGAKDAKGDSSKETKSTGGEKKSWKARFAELEAKMAAMSATTEFKATSLQNTLPS